MDGITLIASTLAAMALLSAILLTLQAYEHRRYVRLALSRQPRQWHAPPAVLVCVPCKGLELELSDNLRHILAQDYPNFRIRFVVESPLDPACSVIRKLISETKVPCELLVAGRCRESGQKVHNLRRATANVPADVAVLAFFDSDAKPAPQALARLVHRVCQGGLEVVTGYRWFVPRRPTAANLTLASINAALAGLLKHHGWNFVWGGSWAVTRELFEKAGVSDAWRGTLSDDLVANRVLRAAGARVVFEPGCMAESPIDVGWREATRFLRRQFVIGRVYAPCIWWLTAPLMVIQPVVLLGGFALSPLLARSGNPLWWVPLVVSGSMYALAVLRGHWRQAAWGSQFNVSGSTSRAAAMFDRFASPLSCVYAAGTMLAATVGRSIVWRGINYHMGPAGRVMVLGRVPTGHEQDEMRAMRKARLNRDQAAARAANKNEPKMPGMSPGPALN